MGDFVRSAIRKAFPIHFQSFHLSTRPLYAAVAVLAIAVLGAPSAQAQVSAAISGRVTDPTGAVVSGATVAAKNVDTGVARTTMTDDAGRYSVLALPVGDYEVRCHQAGFPRPMFMAGCIWWWDRKPPWMSHCASDKSRSK